MGGGRRQETGGEAAAAAKREGWLQTRVGVVALMAGCPTLGSMVRGVATGMESRAHSSHSRLHALPGSPRLSPSLPSVSAPSQRRMRILGVFIVYLLCALYHRCIYTQSCSPRQEGQVQQTPPKGSRNMEEKVRTWEKCLGKWIPWKDPHCQDLSCF